MFPPTAEFTEKECPDQSGKALNSYSKNATVYLAGRSREKAFEALKLARATSPSSKGRLEFLSLDLADLSTIAKSANEFLKKESRLDVLWNNAGVMTPPAGSKTAQNYEAQLGANCLGPFLFTQLLRPILVRTAASSPPDSVRICWAPSLMAEANLPKGVIDFEDINGEKGAYRQSKLYSHSKVGNIFLGWEFARRLRDKGVISVTFNPGNLRTPLQRHVGCLESTFSGLLLHPPIFGAYTELFAGLSPEINSMSSGCYIIPWGRIGHLKENLAAVLKSQEQGGTGVAKKFYEWCESETKVYLS